MPTFKKTPPPKPGTRTALKKLWQDTGRHARAVIVASILGPPALWVIDRITRWPLLSHLLDETRSFLSTPTPLWSTILLLFVPALYARWLAARLRKSMAPCSCRHLKGLRDHSPAPGVSVYVHDDGGNWLCRHCADSDGVQSVMQMVHHSGAGKDYECHRCKFRFRVPASNLP